MNGFSGATRKPDLILCDKCIIDKCEIKNERPYDLRTDVYVIGEMKNKNTTENVKASFIELAGKVVFQLENQDGRYATPGIQILGTDLILTYFDRGGSVTTYPFDIHQSPTEFLRILLGISFGDHWHTVLGFDPTVSSVVNGKKEIQIERDDENQIISVDNLLFISGSLHGRGTTVWSGKATDLPGFAGKVVVVKDSFVDPLRRYTEGKILKILAGKKIEGIPVLIHEQQVQLPHPLDGDLVNQSTHILRSLVTEPLPPRCKYHLRVLSRLVTMPKGDPIFEFSSLAELLVGIIDCLKGESRYTVGTELLLTSRQCTAMLLRKRAYFIEMSVCLTCYSSS